MDDYQDTQEGRRAIYRIGTRRDYGGEEFKTWESIQEKLEDRRKEKPDYKLKDIEDFVGLRVVCIYPSDVDIVREYIKKLWEDGKLAKYREDRAVGKVKVKAKGGGVEERETGYKAWHFTVNLPGRLNIFNCEIQVMTILDDAAAVKTHDLIYKTTDMVKAMHVKQAKLLSDSLAVIDEQSSILKREIQRKWHIEEEKKNVAKEYLILDIAKRLEFSEGSEIHKLRDHIIAKKEELRYGAASEESEEMKWIRQIAEKELDLNLCRVVGLLAIIREGHVLDEYALEFIDRYIDQASDDRDKSEAHIFKSLILSTFGNRGAVEEAEKALQYGESSGDEKLINDAKENIAYFIAEFEQVNRETLARNYSEEVYKVDPSAENLETKGYVQITFGKSPEEVLKGLKLCKQALNKSKENKKMIELFLRIDEHRVLERLWEFVEEEFE